MILADLMLRLRANSADLQKGLDQSKKHMKDAGNASRSLNKTMKDGFKSASSSLTSMIPGWGGYATAVRTATVATKGLTTATKGFAKALVATGVGAILVAIGLAIGALISYFKGTKEGADKFNKTMGGIKGVIDEVMHRIHLLGEAVSLLLQRKFKEAAAKAKEAFTDLGKSMKDNWEDGVALAERENILERKKIAFITEEAELTQQIARNREIANDEQYSINQRMEAALKAEDLTRKLANERIEIAEEELDILTKKNALGDNLNKNDRAEQEARAAISKIREEESLKMLRIGALQETITREATGEAKARAESLKALKEENKIIPVSFEHLNPKSLDTNTLAPMQMGEIEPPNFESTTTAWQDLWETIHDFGGRIYLEMDALKEQSFSLGEALYSSVANAMSGLVGTLAEGANSFKEYASNLKAATKSIIGDLISQAVASMVAGALKDWATKVPFGYLLAPAAAALAGGLAKTAFNSMIPGFATGTSFAPGGLALVGERGPELVNLPRGAQVYNNNLTRGMMGGGEVRFIIEQDKLVGILGDYNKKNIYF